MHTLNNLINEFEEADQNRVEVNLIALLCSSKKSMKIASY
jgi:hypothetical protein